MASAMLCIICEPLPSWRETKNKEETHIIFCGPLKQCTKKYVLIPTQGRGVHSSSLKLSWSHRPTQKTRKQFGQVSRRRTSFGKAGTAPEATFTVRKEFVKPLPCCILRFTYSRLSNEDVCDRAGSRLQQKKQKTTIKS